ncbi:MAG TPA: beta-propeller domain-containing protein [Kineosporiaceae bacterium]|nr:beta-propeller domain-containing protein [Kineosporiaceae bacterium]
MSYPLRTAAAVTALGLAGAAIWTFSGGGSETDQKAVSLGRIANVALTTEHDCTDLLAYYRAHATRLVGPYGLNDGVQTFARAEVATDSAAAGKALAPNASGESTQRSAAGTPDSGTNVQVAGVDESDVVKTNGDLMVAVINGEIRITRLAGAETKTLATWRPAEGSAQSVLLDGDTAVVIGDQNGGIPLGAMKLAPGSGRFRADVTDLTVLDLADPAHPRPVRRLELGGTRSGEARLVDGEIRLALTSGPTGITWKQAQYPDGMTDAAKAQSEFEKSEKAATAANKRLIAKSTIADWIPKATVTQLNAKGKPDGPAVSRPLIDCEQVAIPASFSGLRTLALVSMDLHAEAPLTSWQSAGVIADGSTVYATADHVWLATSRWNALAFDGAVDGSTSRVMPGAIRFAPSMASTEIHRFDTPLRAQPKYVASGEITGSLLNQFAMDEKDGLLRVASTTQGDVTPALPIDDLSAAKRSASWSTPQPTPKPSEARVTVLKVNDDRLSQVGVVTGLGVGEQIRGVRFVGDVGYVVTYRQTDPLYIVDLSDPAQPRVRGELAVLGYSAYLHPAGTGRLLGLGQDGTKTGNVTGLQLSLFDVGNLDSPRRLDRKRLANAWSDAESDHHAFTMAGDLVLIPYTSWNSVRKPGVESLNDVYRDRFDAGVIAVRVASDGLGTPTTLRPIADGPVTFDSSHTIAPSIQRTTEATPIRTVVQADTIYTLTPRGVAAHSASDFTRLTFASF